MAAIFRADLTRFDKWVQLQPHIAMLDVDYNNVVTESAPVVADISDFLGGVVNSEAMCNIIDMSLYRNRGAKSLSPT
jgi:hypothetical protein